MSPRNSMQTVSCPAGSPRPGSPGGLQDQPAALGQGEARNFGRPRSIRGASAGRGPRSRDQGFKPEEYWTDRGRLFQRTASTSTRDSSRRTEKTRSFRIKKRSTDCLSSLKGARVEDHRDRAERALPQTHGALHHQPAAAGRRAKARLQREENHGRSPSAFTKGWTWASWGPTV